MTPQEIVIDGKTYTLTRKLTANNFNNENENENLPLNENTSGGGKKSKKSKKVKGTRKLSGYMKFAQEARPKVLAENPEMKSDIVKVGRKIGEMWRGLSADEKARY